MKVLTPLSCSSRHTQKVRMNFCSATAMKRVQTWSDVCSRPTTSPSITEWVDSDTTVGDSHITQ